eukprot:6147172-Prorocentrum_lima.AAC.1
MDGDATLELPYKASELLRKLQEQAAAVVNEVMDLWRADVEEIMVKMDEVIRAWEPHRDSCFRTRR